MKLSEIAPNKGVAILVAFAIVLFAAQGWAQQCPDLPLALPPAHPVTLEAPKGRVCCIFGWALGLDPTKLSGHVYGNGGDPKAAQSETPEPVGYVYTAAAGIVDIGHVRDNADMVLWVYAHLQNGEKNFAVGDDTVVVGAIPKGKDNVLALAASIVYVNSWGHELITWGDSPAVALIANQVPSVFGAAEDFSAFSPEDLSSNIVGIVTASRAIDAGGDASPAAFDAQMDKALAGMMTELGAQCPDVTTKLLAQVQFTQTDKDLAGKWWMKDWKVAASNWGIRLLRRNFDGAPWRISGAATSTTPPWLNTKKFSDLYGQFLYIMTDKLTADLTEVPDTTEYALGSGYLLEWTQLPDDAIKPAAMLGSAVGGGSCLLSTDKDRHLLTSGQYGTATVNVPLAGTQDMIVDMKDATATIQRYFRVDDSCMEETKCNLPAGAQDAGEMDGP
jgi:hypothetical protein